MDDREKRNGNMVLLSELIGAIVQNIPKPEKDLPQQTTLLQNEHSSWERSINDSDEIRRLISLSKQHENGGIKSDADSQKNEDNSKVTNDTNSNASKGQIDIVIIVAVPDEMDGVYKAFNFTDEPQYSLNLKKQYNFTYTKIDTGDVSIAVLIQPEMGMTMATSLATRAILAFSPKLIAMVGICGGREEKTKLGDVIVASNVFDYTAGKYYPKEFKYRPQTLSLDPAIKEFVNLTILNKRAHRLLSTRIINDFGDFPGEGDSIQIHLSTIATGTAIVDDADKIADIAGIQDDLAGIDMEAYALGAAASVFKVPWIVVKAVQDFANGQKCETEKSIRSFAAYASAKLLQVMIEEKKLLQYLPA